ncbi:hypothetical protein OUZ56_014063 [Daphnia magna]|uniref:Uncharacterized protein n=1 Tax=Daphnia magna TaxID=35525 RepID=A0ABQ9Z7S8_9CRUS|nr:hypothetical protein OUZ56_014063 [Daphnia magna]
MEILRYAICVESFRAFAFRKFLVHSRATNSAVTLCPVNREAESVSEQEIEVVKSTIVALSMLDVTPLNLF